MNTKKITLHDCHLNGTIPLRDPPPAPQLPASSAGLPSSLCMSSAPQLQYGGADTGWPREEPAFAHSCFGSSTADDDLLDIAQLDLPPFGMLPPATVTTADRRRFRSPPNSELLRQLDTVMLCLRADQSPSSYRARPQRRDATVLPLPAAPPPQHQELAHHHWFLAKSTASATLPAREASGSSLESHLSATGTSNSSSSAEPPAARPSKTRIRWTQDLHERFLECVNQLGGADKATPKGILKLMKSESEGVTIYHIKSHLQKHRMEKCTPPPSSSSEGKQAQHEKWGEGDTQNPEPKTGMHIREALRVQLDVQRRLHEQLEMQRRLQVRIEEQGKMLQRMFEHQLKASGNNTPYPDDGGLFPVTTAEQDDALFVDIFIDNDSNDGEL